MKAYKCDRCGNLFEGYRGQGSCAFFNVTRNPNNASGCLDLCPNCNAVLQEWIKTGNAVMVIPCNNHEESEVDSERSEEYANRD